MLFLGMHAFPRQVTKISYNKSIITVIPINAKKEMYTSFQYKLKTTKQLYIFYKIIQKVTGNSNSFFIL